MKKVLISMMLVVLTLCLFVACSSSPKKGITITFVDLNLDGIGSGTLTIDEPTTWQALIDEGKTVEIGETTWPISVGMGNVTLGDDPYNSIFLFTSEICDDDVLPAHSIVEDITVYFDTTPV